MVFSSHIFLLYFLPAFLLLYFLVPAKWRNGVLLLASVVFYAWGAPDFVLVLLASTVANFYIVKPIGISFFTFQSVTYVVDTYRGVNRPMKSLVDYVVYIIMFPQLIAGPIVRYNEIADQISARRRLRWDECLQGFYRFVIGLSKKVLIADVIGRSVDMALGGDLAAMDTGSAWITIAAYTMQLYFDFSGYSDMAIGLGRIMGFKFPENFNNPYVSTSVTEFWRRWHITLGTFMRNYLYIPLGGNRSGLWRTYFNLWVVFLLSGLWHGAGWNFVLWGAYHGIFLVVERMTGLNKGERLKWLRVPVTFVVVMVGWALFRIEDLGQCWTFITRLFAFDFTSLQFPILDAQFLTTLGVALIFAFITLFPFGRKLQQWTFYTEYRPAQHIAVWAVACIMFFFCLGALTATDFSPFIYFRF